LAFLTELIHYFGSLFRQGSRQLFSALIELGDPLGFKLSIATVYIHHRKILGHNSSAFTQHFRGASQLTAVNGYRRTGCLCLASGFIPEHKQG
jgi:hypothetical protein